MTRKLDKSRNPDADTLTAAVARQKERERTLRPLRITPTTVIYVTPDKCNPEYAAWGCARRSNSCVRHRHTPQGVQGKATCVTAHIRPKAGIRLTCKKARHTDSNQNRGLRRQAPPGLRTGNRRLKPPVAATHSNSLIEAALEK